jgi:histidinol dehydrogenase
VTGDSSETTLPLPLLYWALIAPDERKAALRRPAQRDADALLARVREIVGDVRTRGDAAVLEYTRRFDCPTLETLEVQPDEFAAAERTLSAAQLEAIDRAIANVRRFHEAQLAAPLVVSTSPGVVCERHYRAIDAVGLYVPAGVAPLPSTAVMLAVPAQIAGCRTRILATPPRADGRADPAVLAIARRCGVERVFKMGGAQAIAAMAYGAGSVPKVDKIFGPGNAWVTAAKMVCANDPDGAALDLPAGPSEVLVIADDSARAQFVAADLLAQAEHSADAQAILVTSSPTLAAATAQAIEAQLRSLARIDTLRESIRHARLIVVDALEAAFDLSNDYAPEHLIVQVREPRAWLPRIRNAGSVFLGAWTPETMGDYCSGTNHVLPTYGFARAYSGLSLTDFVRRMTVQELTPAGLQDLGPTAVALAGLEGLDAHANAVRVRLAQLSGSGA